MSDNSVLLQGDCLEVLKDLPDNSVDSLITDPPAGIAFMGKSWDEDKGGRKQWIAWMTEVMTECLRVLKPGAHGLVWALPRTSHWTGTALEDAGFEIRDSIEHCFGSGFPKSMNISIAIDKQAGVMGHRGKAFVTAGAGDREDIQNTNGWEKDPGHDAITPEAKQWQGWGTALKPAHETWWLVRKPCSEKTVAANVLLHGVGGINIDASRIGSPDIEGKSRDHKGKVYEGVAEGYQRPNKSSYTHKTNWEAQPNGRFPANLIFSHSPGCVEIEAAYGVDKDHYIPTKLTPDKWECEEGCAVAELDRQSGTSKSTANQRNNSASENLSMSGANSGHVSFGHNDSGGASRFFYVAKASKKDKGADNTHPTIKSTQLMSYLIKMITPPNGIVLDCFCGSGSTGVAAVKNGFAFIGIEKEQEYYDIALKRLESAS